MTREDITTMINAYVQKGGTITVVKSARAKGVYTQKMKIQGSNDHSYRRMINARYATRENQGYAQVNYSKLGFYNN